MSKQNFTFLLSIATSLLLVACSAGSLPASPIVPTSTEVPTRNLAPTATLVDILPTPQAPDSTQAGLGFDCQRVREISVDECRALVALYNSTDGNNWKDNSGWLVNEKPCTWYGVGCQQASLDRLDLSHNQLSGSIPAALGNLHNLHWLDLSYNQLNGSIPVELDNMAVLYWAVPNGVAQATREDLRLWGNLLDGTVPASEGPVTAVEFQGVQFDFHSSLAESVWPEIGMPLPPSEGGAWVRPEHIRFTFASQNKAGAFRVGRVGPVTYPQIFIYPTQVFSTMSEIAKAEIEALQTLLEDHPPAPEKEIPLLPLINAAQVFHAQVGYLDFQNGSGVRFITHYSQEVVGRLTKDNIFYTFQGLTRDGKYYVAAFFPITASGLRDEMVDEPWETAQAHLVEDIQYLDSLSAHEFEPDLDLLDAIVQSLIVDLP
jgi:hypothetical protein